MPGRVDDAVKEERAQDHGAFVGGKAVGTAAHKTRKIGQKIFKTAIRQVIVKHRLEAGVLPSRGNGMP